MVYSFLYKSPRCQHFTELSFKCVKFLNSSGVTWFLRLKINLEKKTTPILHASIIFN